MRVTTVALFIVLISLIVLLAVHEEVECVRSEYRMGRLLMRRDRLARQTMAEEAAIGRLKAPSRLMELNDRLKLGLKPLPVGVWPAATKAEKKGSGRAL